MRNVLIGSRALSYWFPQMQIKDTTDCDIITNRPGAFDDAVHVKMEFHDPWLLNNEDFQRFTSDSHMVDICGQTVHVCLPVGLSIIKRSHLWRDLKFDKNITHYHKYLSQYSRIYDDTCRTMLKERTEMTMKLYPQGHPNLMQSKADFFDDAVTKKYNHDYLHELFAYYDKPLYTKLLRQADLAWCDESKWLQLSHEDKLKCIAEEVQVIATERFLIPSNWKYNSKLAYVKALAKVCTTLCSGYFRSAAIDAYPELLQMYNADRFQKVSLILNNI